MSTNHELNVPRFGELDALYAACRRGLPQILVYCLQREGEDRLRVTYRSRGPAEIAWDANAGEYRWVTGADPKDRIGGYADIEEAVRNIGVWLEAATPEPPPPAA
ncbi:hypothetical protein [Actinomadura geliboluensis]|uniref:hypothetical protein n=1 Tax=Actinomadura geliboluensis TaxID=882440 RepID=UPI0036D1330E